MSPEEIVYTYGAPLAALLAGGVVHEYGHAVSAKWLGDDTATVAGRLTLNPVPHLDLFMTFLLPALLIYTTGTAFGGMKPVPIRPNRMHRPSRDLMLSSLAGPAWQIMFAFGVLAVGLLLSPFLHPRSLGFQFVAYGFMINLLIAAFNLIPIPPLDGSRVLRYFLPPDGRQLMDQAEAFLGLLLVIVLLFSGALGPILRFVFGIARDLFAFFWNNLSQTYAF